MPQSEISVAIKGSDTLSPALQKVNATLERSKIALTASGAVAAEYAKRLDEVRVKYATGEIDAIKYEKALNRLEREFQQTAAAVQQFSNNTAAAAGTTNAIITANNNATRGATRLVFGVQAMSVALQGGRVSAQGLIGALTMLGVGSPAFLVITAGLSVIGGLLLGMENRGDRAADAIERATEAARAGVAGMDSEAGLEATIRELEARGRTQVSTYRPATGESASETEQVATTAAQGLTPAEAARLSAARDRLAELRRNRPRGPAGRNARIDWGEMVDFGGFNPAAIERRSAAQSRARSDSLQAQDDMLFPGLERAALAQLPTDLEPIREAIAGINTHLRESAEAWGFFGDAAGAALGAAISAASAGGNVIKAFFDAGLKSLQKEATVKAVFFAAEAIGRALRGDGAGAAKAGQAAALYTGAAIAISAITGGGGSSGGHAARGAAGGGFGGSRSASENAFRGAGYDPRPVQIIQFVTPDGRELSRQIVQTNARQERLGAASVSRVPVNAVVLSGPVTRA